MHRGFHRVSFGDPSRVCVHDPTADAVNGALRSPLHTVHNLARGLDPGGGLVPDSIQKRGPSGRPDLDGGHAVLRQNAGLVGAASKWVNCLPRCRSAEGRRGSGSWFGPSAARRREASTELSPAMTVIADSHVETERA